MKYQPLDKNERYFKKMCMPNAVLLNFFAVLYYILPVTLAQYFAVVIAVLIALKIAIPQFFTSNFIDW
jgi:hypothetical protein